MEWMEAIKARHSVRTYRPVPIESEKVAVLSETAARLSRESGLHIHLITEEPEAFIGARAHYGSIRGCTNYFVLVGEPGREEAVGYYGEQLVLQAQLLGLNTCWVALTYNKRKVPVVIPEREKLYVVVALGYGETPGVPHKSKPLESRCTVAGEMPDWFRRGMEAALLAPTAINQQKFHLTLAGDNVTATALTGPYSKMDLGIVKFHFEVGAAPYPFVWSQ
ncbi:MAG: nitroreductase [Clostridia bacterium]|nr:nitroreductase [Clostridia bacterium]